MLYDALLVAALMMLASVPFIALRGGDAVEPGDPVLRIALVVVAWLFFAGFWSRSGRTLGMQAWRLQVETTDGENPGPGAATLRFFAAILALLPFGLGIWWQLWDRDGLAWHDRLSGTRLKYYPKSET